MPSDPDRKWTQIDLICPAIYINGDVFRGYFEPKEFHQSPPLFAKLECKRWRVLKLAINALIDYNA